MNDASAAPAASLGRPPPPAWHLFVPKLITVLRQGYGLAHLRADVLAGLTVAIVALPLAMALAIASGTTPDVGLVTAVVGGFLGSALGGARFNISGPTGAFVVVVFGVIEKHGYDGLLMATVMAAAMLAAAGLFRLGTWIKYVPEPVVVGFTAGIPRLPFNLPLLKGCEIVGVFNGGLNANEPEVAADNVVQLLQLFEQKLVRPRVSRVFDFADAPQAILAIGARSALGKLVVRVGDMR